MVWERGMGFEEIVPVFRYAVGYLAEEIDGGVWGAHSVSYTHLTLPTMAVV